MKINAYLVTNEKEFLFLKYKFTIENPSYYKDEIVLYEYDFDYRTYKIRNSRRFTDFDTYKDFMKRDSSYFNLITVYNMMRKNKLKKILND